MIATKHKFAIIGIIITITTGLFYYYEYSMMGFPDGHLTEYGRFYTKKLFPVFFGLNSIFLAGFLLSFFLKKKSKQLLILYICITILYFITNYYFSIQLENGQGG